MKPIDLRDHNWQSLRDRLFLSAARSEVYTWLAAHGPATTTQIAEGTGLKLLTVRPRVTELQQHGFLVLVADAPRIPGIREGVYQVRTPDEFAAWRDEQLQPTSGQIQMPLNPLPSPLSPLTADYD